MAFGQILQRSLANQPTMNDQGQLVGFGQTQLPRPADHTDLALSRLTAMQSHFKPVMTAQTNQTDEAYNHMPFVPNYQYAPLVPQNVQNQQQNKALQQTLYSLFGGRR